MHTPRLVDRDEDRHLRRLHLFEQLGATLAPELQSTKLRILRRDQRRTIRRPVERGVTRA